MGIAPLLLVLQGWSPASISEDSARALRELAQRAEWSYEYLLRSLAPVHRGSYPSAQHCDEIVGRFCLTFDGSGGTERQPDTTVAGKVVSARQQAVEMLRHAFAALPGELTTIGPLLRYLVEDGRAEEAVAAARTYAWASGDSAWGGLLIGYAFHAAAEDSLAELYLTRGLAELPPEARRRVENVSYLLAHGERSAYRKLSEQERATYEAALWRLADPLYLTPGNERYAEHLARHVWARLLSEAPKVSRMYRWGDDLEQLTVRYGVPSSRERLLSDVFSLNQQESMIEYYDPEQLSYLPESLYTAGVPPTPPPGSTWNLEDERARSGYRPLTIRRLQPLEHQVSRFPAGQSTVLRIDASIVFDSVARGAESARTGLFLLDRAFQPVTAWRSVARIRADTASLSFETIQPAGAYIYSAELLEESSAFAGRARYSIELPSTPPGHVALSDPVVAAPFGTAPPPRDRHDFRLQPRASLIVAASDTIGLFAEAHNLRTSGDSRSHFSVELKVGAAEEPPLIARAWNWLGRKIGIAKPATTPRLAWEGEGEGGSPAILAVDLTLEGLDPGLYAIELSVTDLVASTTATSTRLIRIRQ